jgi:hypothetical protein
MGFIGALNIKNKAGALRGKQSGLIGFGKANATGVIKVVHAIGTAWPFRAERGYVFFHPAARLILSPEVNISLPAVPAQARFIVGIDRSAAGQARPGSA